MASYLVHKLSLVQTLSILFYAFVHYFFVTVASIVFLFCTLLRVFHTLSPFVISFLAVKHFNKLIELNFIIIIIIYQYNNCNSL
jgi:hypothetical protein